MFFTQKKIKLQRYGTLVLLVSLLLCVHFVSASSITGFDGNGSISEEILYLDSLNNRVGINTSTPTHTLTIVGNLLGFGYINSTSDICLANGNCLSSIGGGSFWTNSSGNATYTSGNVGVGTTAPEYPLTVGGDIAPTVSDTYNISGFEEFNGDVSLETYADATWFGENETTSSRFGEPLSGVGDVNGDGYDDIIIGAPLDDQGGLNAGKMYLILGKENGWTQNNYAEFDVDASWIGEAGDALVQEISIASDVNGDGLDDILVGGGGSITGEVFIIFGKTSGWTLNNYINTSANASFVGEASGESVGSIEGVGDVNEDGFDDFILSTYENNYGGNDAGKTYLVLGKASGWTMDTNVSEVAVSSWYGEAPDDRSGSEIRNIGDTNNDGYDDIMIGAYLNDYAANAAGKAYLILGPLDKWGLNNNLSNSNASWYGQYGHPTVDSWGDNLGEEIRRVGDVNADGYDDVLLLSDGNDEGASNKGQAYLILGPLQQFGNNHNISEVNASWLGGTYNVWSGMTGEDINNDGYNDIFLSTNTLTNSVRVFYGKATGWSMDNSIEDYNLSFATIIDSSGSVASAGDVNGDGYNDIIIGANDNDENGNDAGKFYLQLSPAKQFDQLYTQTLSASDTITVGETTVINASHISSEDSLNISANTIFLGSRLQTGYLNATDYINATIDVCIQNGGCLSTAGSYWTLTNGNTTYTAGKVSVGTTNPNPFTLSVNGSIGPQTNDAFDLGSSSRVFATTHTKTLISNEIIQIGELSFFNRTLQALNNITFAVETLALNGVTNITGSLFAKNINVTQDACTFGGDCLSGLSPTVWTKTNNNLSYTAGRIGIGVSEIGIPDIDVAGSIGPATTNTYNVETSWIPFTMDTLVEQGDASWMGTALSDWLGTSSAVGDVNGDGYDDIVVGGWGNNEGGGDQAGKAFLILGRTDGWRMVNDARDDSIASWIGEAAGDRLGKSSYGPGDVNGDGYDDIIIFASMNEDNGGDFDGKAYLLLGRETGWTKNESIGTAADGSWYGEANDELGIFGCQGGGDVNNDGYDDIIIGAWGNDQAGTNAGKVYLILGKKDGWTTDNRLDISEDASWTGEPTGQWFGSGCAIVEDVNGDNYDDIVIGAYGQDEGGANRGEVYLVFGKANGWTTDNDINTTANASWVGSKNDGDQLGAYVSTAGDFNNDGYGDIIMGADLAGVNQDEGIVYLIFGRESGWSIDNPVHTTANISWHGEAQSDQLGLRLLGGFDINLDGYDDILLSAYLNDARGDNSGQVYLVLGSDHTGGSEINITTEANASWIGENIRSSIDDLLGISLGVGDFNNDGYTDILLGAENANGEDINSQGETYMHLSKKRSFKNLYANTTNVSQLNVGRYLNITNDTIHSTKMIQFNASIVNITGELNFTNDGSVDDNSTCTIIYSPDRTRRLEVCD